LQRCPCNSLEQLGQIEDASLLRSSFLRSAAALSIFCGAAVNADGFAEHGFAEHGFAEDELPGDDFAG
jgi:hypothetical protein